MWRRDVQTDEMIVHPVDVVIAHEIALSPRDARNYL
jgi:hypothetical protein